ncbi:hypothetical protein K3495_g2281 [Podosphaera aphanis]|nr:hypothetical protein K3495_g2281 [Podosphaera aphanis]
MDDVQNLPNALSNITSLLERYIKPRQETTKIRRLLRLHLSSCLQTENQKLLNRPLSLPNIAQREEEPLPGLQGLHREYLRHISSYVNVKNEFTHLTKEHHPDPREFSSSTSNLNITHHREVTSTESFIDLERKRDRQKRLRIIQRYLEILSLKPAASVDYLDPINTLKDLKDLPKIPIEVIQPTSIDRVTTEPILRDIVSRLEKSILRAKINLKREKKLLSEIRTEEPEPISNLSSRLIALGITRNELIKWIEAELARTSDFEIDSKEAALDSNFKDTDSINLDSKLMSIHERYLRYVNVRQSLISCINQSFEVPASIEDPPKYETKAQQKCSYASHLLFPYLQELVALSNEQKGFVQQKTYLKASIAKQLSESSQGFDRLAQESHLLPTYPLPSSESKGKEIDKFGSFPSEISSQENRESSLTDAWIFAIKASNHETMEAVLEKLEEGGSLMLEAQNHLLHLQRLPGLEVANPINNTMNNCWKSINGNLGSIKGDIFNKM